MSGRSRDVQLGQEQRSRDHPVRLRDAAGGLHLRGPSAPHGPSRLGLARLHAAQDGGHRTESAGLLRAHPRSAGRQRHVRFRARPRRADADARHRHAARDPRIRAGEGTRLRRRGPPDGGGQADGHRRRPAAQWRLLRRLRRMAEQEPLR